MGLSCSAELREKLGLTQKSREQHKKVYLCSQDGQELTSAGMRGIPETRPVISAECQQIVTQTWDIIKRDIERVGVVMFMGLLEDPGVKGTFKSFQDQSSEELVASTSLRSHVLRVMAAVEKVVARLDSPDKLVPLLHDLGHKHVVYNARPEFLDLVGPQFNNAIQPALGQQWTPEVEQAWADLFRYITHVMKEAMVM